MIANWLPEDFLKTIVLFLLKDNNGNFSAHGTGILANVKNAYMLITCKHVVINPSSKEYYKGLHVSVNKVDGSKSIKDVEAIQKQFNLRWFFHQRDEVDLAISPIAIEEGKDDIKLISSDTFESFNDIPLGEDVFFLGYPLSLGIENVPKLSPLVRTGIVSLKLTDKTFLIDANVYPGSSGSPVFYKPTIAKMVESSINIGQVRNLKMLGIVSGNINTVEEAISKRTGKTRTVFEENSGLGIVQSAELIKEIIESEKFQEILPKTEKAQETAEKEDEKS